MGRWPRLDEPWVTYHVVLRCNNNEWLLQDDAAKQVFLALVFAAAERFGLVLYAYAMMDNHVHLVLARSDACRLAVAMHWLMTQGAKDLHRHIGRHGHFWQHRYRAVPVEENEYALALLRYVDRNPVRAGLVSRPADYGWSSCAAYVLGSPVRGVTLHPTYLGLAGRPGVRRAKYGELVEFVPPGGDSRHPLFSRARALGRSLFRDRLGARGGGDDPGLASVLDVARRVMRRRTRPAGRTMDPEDWASISRWPPL